MNLRHVGITVTDMDASIDFYRDIFGFTIQREMNESGKHIDNFSGLDSVDVRTVKMSADDGSLIELLHYNSHPMSENLTENITYIGCSHFAITVDDLDKTYGMLSDKNHEILCEPQYSPDGKVKLTFCKDPDGTLIELVEELK